MARDRDESNREIALYAAKSKRFKNTFPKMYKSINRKNTRITYDENSMEFFKMSIRREVEKFLDRKGALELTKILLVDKIVKLLLSGRRDRIFKMMHISTVKYITREGIEVPSEAWNHFAGYSSDPFKKYLIAPEYIKMLHWNIKSSAENPKRAYIINTGLTKRIRLSNRIQWWQKCVEYKLTKREMDIRTKLMKNT